MSGSNFGELVLILGDLHIPERANKISAPFKRMLVPNKMQHLICTGNVTSSEQYQELLSLAPAVHCVAGDCDCEDESFQQSQQHQNPQQQQQQASNTGEMSFPETCVIQVGQFRIGVIHGHQLIPWGSKEAVDRMRRKLRVDVLVTGHTHQNTVVDEGNGYLHINPVRYELCLMESMSVSSI